MISIPKVISGYVEGLRRQIGTPWLFVAGGIVLWLVLLCIFLLAVQLLDIIIKR